MNEKGIVFYENLQIALENVLIGKTTKGEYDWRVKGKTGFKIWKSNEGAIIVVRNFKE